ncbi:MAG: aspartate aminotransferase family protein [Anaerolineales bacterium]|nr:aspartate aminotransferase family protein [Anaerolineales bacterium]
MPNDIWKLSERYDADFIPSSLPVVIERGEGALLTDSTGHQTIDLGDIIANVGHCHPRHVAALQRAAAQMIVGKGNWTNPARARLMQQLVELTPENLNEVFFATSGSEIIEWAIRIARRFTGRHEILSFWGGVYGRTIGAISLNGLQRRRRKFGPLMPGVIHSPYAYCYRCPFGKTQDACDFFCVDFLDQILEAESTDTPAGLIVEPYAGVGGILFPPDGYLPRLQKWAADRDLIFVLDEVQSSFGRTGKMFALEWENLRPNILCLGKGMGGGISIAAFVAEARLADALAPGEMSGGNGGNPFACESALAVLEIMRDENLAEHSRRIGDYLLARCRDWQTQFDIIGDVRGRGLCVAIEFVKDRATKEPLRGFSNALSERCYPKGVALHGTDHILSFRPPLVITQEQAVRALDVIEETIKELVG